MEQTLPLSDYLLGTDKHGGAHARFAREQVDWTFFKCYQKMHDAKPGQKLATFDKVRDLASETLNPKP